MASYQLVIRILRRRPQDLAQPFGVRQPGGRSYGNRAIALPRLFYFMAPCLGLPVAALARFSGYDETRSYRQEQARHSLPAQKPTEQQGRKEERLKRPTRRGRSSSVLVHGSE